MKIYLIRHGESTGDVEGRYGGAYDDDLSEKGITQAQALADKLSDSGIQIIFSSPLKRAQQTAKILASKLNCKVKTIKDLRERNKNGILTGMTKKEALQKYPELVEKLKDYRNQIERAESQEDFSERIKKTFMEIVSNENYPTIGIVTHGMPFWVIFADILKSNISSIGDCAYATLNKKGEDLTLKNSDRIEYEID